VAFVAVLGLSVGAAYAAGVIYGRNTAPKPTPTATAAAGGAQARATAGAGDAAVGQQGSQGGRGGAANAPIVGTISSVEGKTLKITPPGGSEMTVNLGDSTQIGLVSASDSGALSQGATVLVVGQRGQDGTITPTSVIVLPQGFNLR
jgi:hypothetical protein